MKLNKGWNNWWNFSLSNKIGKTFLFQAWTNLKSTVWDTFSAEECPKSKTGRLVLTPTGFGGGGNLIFFIRENEIRSFSPNYNVELIYGGKGWKSLISRVRSGSLEPNEKRHGQLHRMRTGPGVWRTLDCLSKWDLLSSNEWWLWWAQSRVDRIPPLNDRLVGPTSVQRCVCPHFIIWLHQTDGAEDRWASVYEAA